MHVNKLILKNKNKIVNRIFPKHAFGQPDLEPVKAGWHEKLQWQSSGPSRWQPQHMWHDLLWHGYTGVPSHCANSRQGPQMCADLLGAAAK